MTRSFSFGVSSLKEKSMDKMDQENLDDILKQLRFKPLPYDVEDNYKRLKANLHEKEVKPVGEKNFRIWRMVGIAASFALLLMTTYHLLTAYSPQEMVWYEITAVPDAKTKVILPDSTTVWLNANASLRYPHAFNGDKRNVQVSGEALFEVQKDEKPFIVDLEQLRIKVLGTVFNVITDKKEDEVEVVLLEGKVALFNHDNLTDIPNKVLEPNELAIYSKSENNIFVSPIRTDAVTSWVTGNFRFEGNTLEEITAELERAFHTKIHIENEGMKLKTFNAIFEDKETLDEILSILQISARYNMEKRKGEIYIN